MNTETGHSSKHPTVKVTVGEWSDEIDVEIAPLIHEIWMAEIETMMSCQEVSPGIAWIAFAGVSETLRFLNIVARFEPGIDTLYNRINCNLAGTKSAPDWEYQFNLFDTNSGQEEQISQGRAFFGAFVSIYFPTTDIPVLIDRLQEFNNEWFFSSGEPGSQVATE